MAAPAQPKCARMLLDGRPVTRYAACFMAVRLEIRPQINLRSLESEPRSGEGFTMAWGMFSYWLAGFAVAYAIHTSWLPVGDWLQMTWLQRPEQVASAATEPDPSALDVAAGGYALPRPPGDAPVLIAPASPHDPQEVTEREVPAGIRTGEPKQEPLPDTDASAPDARPAHNAADRVTTRQRRRPTRTEPARTEPARTEPARTKPARPKPARTEPARTEPARSESRPRRSAARSSGSGSCEAAISSYRQELKLDGDRPADLTSSQYGGVLNGGGYFSHCGVPASTVVNICAAVQHGRAVGVTVTTTPSSRPLNRCVANAVRGLGFPSHPLMDVTTTVFAAAR